MVTSVSITREDFPNRLFPPHGKFSAVRDGQLVLMEATGPFNVEMMDEYIRVSSPLQMEAHEAGPVVTLVQYYDSMMMSPDTIARLAYAVKFALDHGWVSQAVAYVVPPEVEGRDLIVPRIEQQVFLQTRRPFRVFDEREPAIEWLKIHLPED